MIPQPSEAAKSKLLSVINEEWQPKVDIQHWAELSESCTERGLKALLKEGKVQRVWDGLLGVYYYKAVPA